jgi:hypothetical protein
MPFSAGAQHEAVRETAPGPVVKSLDMFACLRRLSRITVHLSVLCILLSSCAKEHAVGPIGPELPFRGPVTIQALRDNLLFNTVSAIRSEVRARVFKDNKNLGRFSGVILFRSPGHMRLRIFDLFGSTVMDMVSDPELMQISIPAKGLLYEGETSMFGAPPKAKYSMENGEDHHVLYAFKNSDSGIERLGKYSFDPLTLRNTGMTSYLNGMEFMTAGFDRFSGPVPMFISISFFNGFVIEMTLDEPELNGDIPDGNFSPVPAHGNSLLPLESLLFGPMR